MAAQAKRDQNRIATLIGVSSADLTSTELVAVDPVTNRLLVSAVITGGSSSGTEYTEGDTDASITGTAILWEDTSDTLRSVSAAKPLPVNIVAGSSSGTEYTEDAAAPADPAGGTLMITRDDQLSTVTEAEGDWSRARGTSKGALWVALADSSGDPITSFGGGTQYATNAAYADGNTGTLALTIRDDALSTLTEADGDYSGLRVDAMGRLWANVQNTVNITGNVNGTYTHDIASGTPTAPVIVGGVAKAAAPTDVSADFDAVQAWYLRNGAQATVLTAAGALIGATSNALDINIKSGNPTTIAVTNAGTFVTQENGAALTSLQLIDDVVYTDDTSTHATGTSKGVGIMAAATPTDTAVNANDIGMLAMSVDRRLYVDASGVAVPVTDNSGSLTIDNAALSVVGGGVEATALRVTIASDSTGLLSVDDNGSSLTVDGTVAFSNSSIAVTNAGTFVVQENGAALTALQLIDDTVYTDDTSTHATGTSKGLLMMAAATPTDTAVNANDIGALAMTVNRELSVSLASVPSHAVTNAGTFAVQDSTAQASLSVMDDWDNGASDGASVSGDVAHDSADAGEPVKIGAKAYSPDGTTPGTAVAENDRTNLKTDLDGRLFVRVASPTRGRKHLDGSTAYTDESLVADPGDGFQVVIDHIQVSTGAATAMNFFLEEGATKIWGPVYLEATAGRGYVSGPIHLPVTASTAVTITTSASIAQSIDVLYHVEAV